jgi:hypothetical protein
MPRDLKFPFDPVVTDPRLVDWWRRQHKLDPRRFGDEWWKRLPWWDHQPKDDPEDLPTRPLRIGTFNTAMLSDAIAAWENGSYIDAVGGAVAGGVDDATCGVLTWLTGNKEENQLRAERLVARVLDSPYDVIALNEVFDEDCRKAFMQGLGSAYPHMVVKLGPQETTELADLDWTFVDRAFTFEDSGLMLFSKWPFAQPPLPHLPVPWSFLPYNEWATHDGMACKGAAAVTIRHPLGRIAVGFTHLQASYDGGPLEHAKVREAQMRQFGAVLASHAKATDATFAVACGDLNIQGAPGFAHHPDIPEWVETFDTPGSGIWSDAFADVWFADGPRHPIGHADAEDLSDVGPTHNSGQRLDYVVSGTPELAGAGPIERGRRLVAHHAMRALNLFVDGDLTPSAFATEAKAARGGSANLSDHFGLNAILNRSTPHCCPQDAQVVGVQGNPSVHVTVTSELAGGMQWLYLPEPGCYWIKAVTGNDVEVLVFSERDLSVPWRPLTSPIEETEPELAARYGERFVALEPCFVRVRPRNDGIVGHGTVNIEQPDGAEALLALVVPPFTQVDHAFPDQPINTDDALWVELALNKVTSGAAQRIAAEITWMALDGPPAYEAWFETPTGEILAKAGASLSTIELGAETGSEAQSVFLRIKRLRADAPAFRMSWATNVTIVSGLHTFGGTRLHQLVCEDETQPDWWGEDELDITVVADGATVVAKSADADTGTKIGMPKYSFVHGATVTADETGDTSGKASWTIEPSPQLEAQEHAVSKELDDGNYRLEWMQAGWIVPSSGPK